MTELSLIELLKDARLLPELGALAVVSNNDEDFESIRKIINRLDEAIHVLSEEEISKDKIIFNIE